jgi:hypothetical protein
MQSRCHCREALQSNRGFLSMRTSSQHCRGDALCVRSSQIDKQRRDADALVRDFWWRHDIGRCAADIPGLPQPRATAPLLAVIPAAHQSMDSGRCRRVAPLSVHPSMEALEGPSQPHSWKRAAPRGFTQKVSQRAQSAASDSPWHGAAHLPASCVLRRHLERDGPECQPTGQTGSGSLAQLAHHGGIAGARNASTRVACRSGHSQSLVRAHLLECLWCCFTAHTAAAATVSRNQSFRLPRVALATGPEGA